MVLAHPFRLAGGSAAVVEQGSDVAKQQAVAVLATTRLGEREMVPGFGVSDPTFTPAGAYSLDELNAALILYGPRVTIVGQDVAPQLDGRTVYTTLTFADRDS